MMICINILALLFTLYDKVLYWYGNCCYNINNVSPLIILIVYYESHIYLDSHI